MPKVILTALGILALTRLAFPADPSVPRLLQSWGTTGSAAGEFKNPGGLALDPSGNLFVCDRGNFRIQKFSPTGDFLDMWGSAGHAVGQFDGIRGISTDSKGNVYVAEDNGSHKRVQKFDGNGAYISSWPIQARQIDIDKEGNIYAVLAWSGQLRVYRPDGVLERTVELDQWIRYPFEDVAVDASNGFLFVTNGAVCYRLGFDGTYQDSWFIPNLAYMAESYGSAAMDLDIEGNLYFACTATGFLWKSTPTGSDLSGFSSWGEGEEQRLMQPTGVAVSHLGDVYLADAADRILKLGYSTSIRPTTWGRIKAMFSGEGTSP